MLRACLPILLGALVACGDEEPVQTAPADPCPEISLDGMAGDWIKVQGSSGDHKTRLRVLTEGGAWSGWYVNGGFRKMQMSGELRTEDLMLTQVPTGAKKDAFDQGQDTITRLYFQPNKKKCSMRVVEVRLSMVEGKEKEQQVGAGYTEYLPFPESQEFTYRPCDDSAFIDEAARSWKVARKQLDEGSVNPVGALGEAVPVVAWVEDPALEGCTYDADLYFDDRPAEGKQAVPATTVDGMLRFGADDWYAPYSGNHHFEIYRYKTCGGERELMAVSCLEAVLD
jgi:hypothetical protein